MRKTLLCFSLYSSLVACGSISLTDSSDSPPKSLTINSSQFSGKYNVKTISISSDGRSLNGIVSRGECSFSLSDADGSGWREGAEDANCEITFDGLPPSPVIGLSKSKLRISSDGEVVDGKLSASTLQSSEDWTIESQKTLFTSKKFVTSVAFSRSGQSSIFTAEYALE